MARIKYTGKCCTWNPHQEYIQQKKKLILEQKYYATKLLQTQKLKIKIPKKLWWNVKKEKNRMRIQKLRENRTRLETIKYNEKCKIQKRKQRQKLKKLMK